MDNLSCHEQASSGITVLHKQTPDCTHLCTELLMEHALDQKPNHCAALTPHKSPHPPFPTQDVTLATHFLHPTVMMSMPMCRGATPRDHRILPRRIILVRHAESEGNIDNFAYTYVPDPQVPLVSISLHTPFVQSCACISHGRAD